MRTLTTPSMTDYLPTDEAQKVRLSSTPSLRNLSSTSGGLLVRIIRSLWQRLHLGRGGVWTMIWIAMGGAAVYFLLPEVEGLRESLQSMANAQPWWLTTAAGLVVLRYMMAALSLRLAVGRSLPLGPMLLVQVSSAFVGRLTPEGVGWLVLNQRYLERSGLGRASALAAITLKVLAGAVMRVVVMAVVAVLAGSSGVFRFDVPSTPPYLLGFALVAVLIGLILLMALRRAGSQAMAPIVSGARDLRNVFRQPLRAAALFGTSGVLTISYGLVLAASLAAFGVNMSLLEVFAVYLGGTAVASASPTPGNLGAVEVALSAGLTAAGVAPETAVGAVLIYRLLTFWLPVVPGFIAFRYLQKKHYI